MRSRRGKRQEAVGETSGDGRYLANRCAKRSRALAASTSRYLGGALVSKEARRLLEIAVIPSTAARKGASFAFDGLLKPLTFRTNCSEAARISSSVTGGEKLNRIFMFRHIPSLSMFFSGVHWPLDSNNSTGLPEGSSTRTCLPPGPETMSLRRCGPERFSLSTNDARSPVS